MARSMGVPFYEDVTPPDLEKINPKSSFVVDSPLFCLEDSLRSLMQKVGFMFPYHEINLIYFENNPEACRVNAKERDKKVNGMITYLSENYNPPQNSVPVYFSKSKEK